MTKPKPIVLFHGRTIDLGQHSVILSVDGKRYEYYLTAQQADTVEFLCKRISALRALSFAKSRAKWTMPVT